MIDTQKALNNRETQAFEARSMQSIPNESMTTHRHDILC